MFTQKTNSFQQFQKDLRNCNVYGALVLHGEEEFIINWAIEMIVKKFVSKATAMMRRKLKSNGWKRVARLFPCFQRKRSFL